jgi:phosphatidylglycerophosphate synthase
MATSFGPSALATPANAVTLGRLFLSPLLWAMVAVNGPSWVALGMWIVLASTDGVDGWMARRMGTTRSGAFLDPLADKALVLGAMWALVASDGFWWLPVALITGREVGISVFRSYWGGQRPVGGRRADPGDRGPVRARGRPGHVRERHPHRALSLTPR